MSNPQQSEDPVSVAIRAYAKQLADEAPPFTLEQLEELRTLMRPTPRTPRPRKKRAA